MSSDFGILRSSRWLAARAEIPALDFNVRFGAIIPGLRSLSTCHARSERIEVGGPERGMHLSLMPLEGVLLHWSEWPSSHGGGSVLLLFFWAVLGLR